MRPRQKPTGATEHVATGIAAGIRGEGPRVVPSDPFDEGFELAERTIAAKGRLAAASTPEKTVEARKQLQQAREQTLTEQAERRKPKPTAAEWRAGWKAKFEAMTPEQREAFTETDTYGKFSERAQSELVRILSAVEHEQWDREAGLYEGIEYQEDAEDEELPEPVGYAPADWTEDDDEQQQYIVDPETGLLEEVDGWAA